MIGSGVFRVSFPLAAILGVLAMALPAEGTTVDWPRRIGLPGGRAVLYEPKVEKHDGNEIEAVAAVSMLIGDATVPLVGSVRFAGKVLTEQNSDMATLEIERVIDTDFPPGTGGDRIEPGILARSEMPRWNIPITVEAYHALLSSAREGRAVVGTGTETGRTPDPLPPRSMPPEYSGLTIMTSVHPKAEFPPSGTFNIPSIRVSPEAQQAREPIANAFRNALARHLAEKGYRYEPGAATPEFQVNVDLSLRAPREGDQSPPGGIVGNGGRKPGERVLALEIRDPESGRRLWRGTAEGRGMTGIEADPGGRADFIVGRMLAGFPPEGPGEEPARNLE
jgi:hypothetical protein